VAGNRLREGTAFFALLMHVSSAAFAEMWRRHLSGASTMLDLAMLAIGLGFFALSVGYVYACERL
jgi:hypothetical protein